MTRSASRAPHAVAAMALVAVGCAGAVRYARTGAGAAPLAVRAVDWNPARAPIASVSALADDGEVVLLLGGTQATLMRAGAAVARADGGPWRDAAVIPAADGSGSWRVAVDDRGRVVRLRAGGGVERIGERWGLGAGGVRALVAAGGRRVAFLGADALMVADGANVERLSLAAIAGASSVQSIAGGGGRIALLVDERGVAGVRVLDAATHSLRAFPIRARAIALDDTGRLAALTDRALYVEDERGQLVLRYLSDARALHGLAAGSGRAWFGDGERLGVVEGAEVALTRDARLAPAATLRASPTGDVWALGGGALDRWARDDAALTPVERWTRLVAPVFARSCSACHLPGGKAGLDLSLPAAWSSERDSIRLRVLDKHTMPPPDHPLADADREAIHRWLDGK
jgi:mono/diheme cytochrome c family protein